VSPVIINYGQSENLKGDREGPISCRVRDIHDLIDLKVRIYFNQEENVGQCQKERGYEFGVLVGVTHDADRKKLVFEIAVGLGDKGHIYAWEKDIDIPRALGDLAKLRNGKERQAFREKQDA
jgi:hypothetical protein